MAGAEPTPASPPDAIRDAIRDRALAAGFDAVGFAPASLPERAGEHLRAFVAAGRHGDMGWLAETVERRSAPDALWPEARSVILVAANYGPAEDPLAEMARSRAQGRGTISVYARNRDYHDLMKKRLRVLARWVHETFATEVKLFVDTAPVMEKPLAMQAGLGWQGKHTNLVSREFGSWLFLGSVFTGLALEPDRAETDHCGACRRCLDACPTAAFDAPYRLDARRCISYLTIEHKGHIPAGFRTALGTRIYGCDDCLAVCPWNKFARATAEPDFLPRAALTAARLADLAALDDAAFRALFSGSPVKRIGRNRFLRNVLIALGNLGDRDTVPAVAERLEDESPLVRAMAVWALARLAGPADLRRLAERHLPREGDADVRSEWEGALALSPRSA
ncbi:MAG: tRNA epoxyqueuosine(34) reductase QueG [Alphaproteobacteria bacterium]